MPPDSSDRSRPNPALTPPPRDRGSRTTWPSATTTRSTHPNSEAGAAAADRSPPLRLVPERPSTRHESSRTSVWVREHGFDRPDLVGDEHRVRVAVIGDTEYPGEHPALAALPGGVVDGERVAVHLARVGRKKAPGDDPLDCRVPDAAGVPIQDHGEPAAF